MKRSLAVVVFMLAAGYTALAQTNARKSPAGEPPLNVRNGKARLVGHFPNPTQMRRLNFTLATPYPDQEEQFLQALMTPGSPQFHKFLTADQWIARFAPAVADEQAVVDWATSQGMTVTHRFPNRLIVDVEAPMATIEKALQVKINNYQVDGYTYFANEREPVLPASVAGIVRDVQGLHNLPLMRPASFHGSIPPGAIYNPGPAVGPPLTWHSDGDRAKYEQARAASHANVVHPNETGGLYDPTDIYAANAYDYDALQNQGHCCNPNALSSGAPPQSSIAIAAFGNLQYTGSYPNATFTDLVGFIAQYPYLASNGIAYTINGGPGFCTVTPTNPCRFDRETTLDTEWAIATSNSFGSHLNTAQVFVYQGEGGYPGDVFNQILSDGSTKVLTTSFSCGGEDQCGGSATSGTIGSMHSIFNSMAGQGWTMMADSGDQGATGDCTTTSVEYPASDPNIVGVGGTQLQSGGLGGTFLFEHAWAGVPFPGSCATNQGGSTGGCSAVFGVPPYQVGLTPYMASCGTQRAVPDIALNAGIGQSIYFNGSLTGGGGTSIATPMMAGFFAQEGAYLVYLDSITKNNCGTEHLDCFQFDGGIGVGNYYLYDIGLNPSRAPHYPFYDVTVGNNSNDITAAPPYPAFYSAGTGYDLVTGWGSANMLQLGWAINALLAGDFGAPAVNFFGAVDGKWYNVPPTVFWSITDTSGSSAVPDGVAGFSQALDVDPGDPYLGSRASTNNSYFSGPEFPNVALGLLTQTTIGCHTVNVRAWDNGGTSSNSTFSACYDPVPPTVVCGTADGLWHANNVSITCHAAASISGLAVAADASFNLTTSVSAGTETNNACTNSHVVYDNAGNSTTGGPICGNMVDRTPPAIVINSPAAAIQYLQQGDILTLSYAVTDTGSGVNTITPTMDGSPMAGGVTIYNGQPINLATFSLGTHTFLINATDKAGNASSLSVTFNVVVLTGNNCNGTYTGTDDGNLTVSSGQSCTFTNGSVTGNVTLNGGTLTLNGGSVGGNLTQNGGSLIVNSPSTIRGNLQISGGSTFSLLGPTITIMGNLQVQNIPASAGLDRVCGSSVGGNLQFQNNGVAIEIGGTSPPCAGNTVHHDLQVTNNTAPIQIYSNAVGGNLQVQNNTASVAIYNNSSVQLQCNGNNPSINGGGNTAPQKQGQCATF